MAMSNWPDQRLSPTRFTSGRGGATKRRHIGAAREPLRARPESVSAWRRYARRPGLVVFLLAVATWLAYAPTAWNGFVNYDDPDYVTSNPDVQHGLTFAGLKWALTTGHASNWHPVTWLSHMLDWQLFGQQARGHHLVSLGFHITNTVMLFLLARLATGAFWRSVLLSAVFALHPLHVESVAWVSERKDVLSTFFMLIGLIAYTRYALAKRVSQASLSQASGQTSGTCWLWYACALCAFLLGLMSKPMLVTFPFLLLLWDFWPLERIGWRSQPESGAGTSEKPFAPRKLVALVIEKLPFLVLSAVSCGITFVVQRQGGAVSTVLSLGERLSNAIVAYARYVGKTLWPTQLSVLYPHPGHWPAWAVLGSGLLLLLIFACTLKLARPRPALLVGWLWFFGSLVPVIGLVQVGMQSMADRYMYIPMIGLSIMALWGVVERGEPSERGAQALGFVVMMALGFCGGFTLRQTSFWHDSETLFLHAVKVTPNNYLAWNNLGFYLAERGENAEAMECYQKSVQINASYGDALNNIGHALAGKGRYTEALPFYQRAMTSIPNNLELRNNYGNALAEMGQLDEGIAQYRFVLARKPGHVDAHNNLGIALAMKGEVEEAIREFREAVRLKPGYASAHSNLGNALAVRHQLDEAIREYEECLRLKPNDAQARNNLGNVLLEKGEIARAIPLYEEALRLNPQNPEAHFNLGVAHLREGKRDEAAAHFNEALKLKPDYKQAQEQLLMLRGAAP